MDTKTRAWIDLALGVVLLIGAVGWGLLEVGYCSGYQLFYKSAVVELLLWGFMALACGWSGGVLITKAYYALTGKRPYEK